MTSSTASLNAISARFSSGSRRTVLEALFICHHSARSACHNTRHSLYGASRPSQTQLLWVGAALGISGQLLSFLGVSARDDVLERRNSAALIAVVGALLGAILCIAGGNIGEGPGVEVVIASAGTALCVWFVLWNAFIAPQYQLVQAHVRRFPCWIAGIWPLPLYPTVPRSRAICQHSCLQFSH
jgi:hypothetical protein